MRRGRKFRQVALVGAHGGVQSWSWWGLSHILGHPPFWFTALPSSGSICDSSPNSFLRSQVCLWAWLNVPTCQPPENSLPTMKEWRRWTNTASHPTQTLRAQGDGVSDFHSGNLLRRDWLSLPFLISQLLLLLLGVTSQIIHFHPPWSQALLLEYPN